MRVRGPPYVGGVEEGKKESKSVRSWPSLGRTGFQDFILCDGDLSDCIKCFLARVMAL